MLKFQILTNSVQYKFISIEGNIGAGKTSLVELLSKHFGCNALFEEFENNPFLPNFYKDIKSHALAVELFFLAERYRQLTTITNQKLVADYYFPKSKIFASFNLQKEEMELFNTFYEVIEQKIILPEIVLFIDRDNNFLRKNILSRGRGYEKLISADYLNRVRNGYFEFFKNENRMPILIINSGESNFYESNALEAFIDKVFTKKWANGVQTIDL